MRTYMIQRSWTRKILLIGLGVALLVGLSLLSVSETFPAAARPAEQQVSPPQKVIERPPACSLLDQPAIVSTMMGLERMLTTLCERQSAASPERSIDIRLTTDDAILPSSLLGLPSPGDPEGVD